MSVVFTARPMNTAHAVCVMLCTLPWSATSAIAQSQVFLRGATEPLVGRVQSLDLAGVSLQLAGDAQGLRVVSWDRVRSIVSADGSAASIPSVLIAYADGLFRVRTRLERGDIDLAARAAERLYAQGDAIEGPSGELLAECVLRVRLARGAHASAISPWLRLLNVRASAPAVRADAPAPWIGGTTTLSPIIDPATGLCPTLPPIFSTLRGPAAVRTLADEVVSLAAPASQLGARAGELLAWYRAAAAHAAGLVSPAPGVRGSGTTIADDGVQLVRELVLARVGNAKEREQARAALQQRLTAIERSGGASDETEQPAPDSTVHERWVAGWCHAALGLSLLREESPESRRRGVLELLHLPARFGDELPQLTRIALAEAAEALRAQGQPAGAALLESELRELEGSLADAPDSIAPFAP